MTDQQRADSLGCAGHPQLRTPNIDRLAAEGVRFVQATTASPICMPARASFATSLYPHTHGIWRNAGELRPEDETFFAHLRRTGYYTAAIGKSHYYDPRQDGRHVRDREQYMRARGFELVHETTGPQAAIHMESYVTDDWKRKGLWEAVAADYRRRELPGELIVDPSPVGVDDYLDSYVGAQAERFVAAYDGAAPLCLFVGFPGPHEPFDAPGAYAKMYRPGDTPSPIPVPGDYASLPERIRKMWTFDVWPQITLDRIPQVRASYYGKVTLIDDWVGRIVDAFRAKGILDQTLVVFLSDHGEMLGDHGRLKKSTFHESNIRIPLILRWPGRIRASTVSQALAEIGDVFPTVLEAAGCPPARCFGRSLWPVLDEPDAELRAFQLAEVQYGDRQFMIRSSRYKFAVDSRSRAYMLYDLETDSREQHNLAVDPAARPLKLRLRRELVKRLEETGYAEARSAVRSADDASPGRVVTNDSPAGLREDDAS
jgi:choline-sulfatase